MGRRTGIGLLVAILVAASTGGLPGMTAPAVAQTAPAGTAGQKPGTTAEEARDREFEAIRKSQAKRLNQARYEDIRRDTDKLLELANQLKRYVENANENTLSLEVIRKAEEIEKLAKDVKSRMKSY